MQRHRARTFILLGLSALALAACGGGDGGSVGGGGTPPVAAPPPTNQPTPPPAPPAVTATARTYAASPLVGRFDFSNSVVQADGTVQGFTSRDGQYFPGYRNAIFGYAGQGAGGDVSRDNSDKFKTVVGIDQQTAIIMRLIARPEIKVVTPVTGLLFEAGSSEAKLERQLGIVGSLFGLTINPDLATYDAIAEAGSGDAGRAADAARMLAANIRALAVNAGLGAAGYGSNPELAPRDVQLGFNEGGQVRLSACLRDAPDRFIFNNADMVAVAQCYRHAGTSPQPELRAATWQAIAHVVNAYAAAVPLRIETSADRAGWVIGIKGYLVPVIAQLAADNSDVSAAAGLAITTQTIFDETTRYVDHYSYNPTGLFNPGPDFLTMVAGSSQRVPFDQFSNTDWQIGAPNGGLLPGGTILSVAVPPGNAGQVTASLAGSQVLVAVAQGFRGVTFFDYVARGDGAEERTARVYIRVI